MLTEGVPARLNEALISGNFFTAVSPGRAMP